MLDPLEEFRQRCRQEQPAVHADDCDMDEDCSCLFAQKNPEPAGDCGTANQQAKPR